MFCYKRGFIYDPIAKKCINASSKEGLRYYNDISKCQEKSHNNLKKCILIKKHLRNKKIVKTILIAALSLFILFIIYNNTKGILFRKFLSSLAGTVKKETEPKDSLKKEDIQKVLENVTEGKEVINHIVHIEKNHNGIPISKTINKIANNVVNDSENQANSKGGSIWNYIYDSFYNVLYAMVFSHFTTKEIIPEKNHSVSKSKSSSASSDYKSFSKSKSSSTSNDYKSFSKST